MGPDLTQSEHAVDPVVKKGTDPPLNRVFSYLAQYDFFDPMGKIEKIWILGVSFLDPKADPTRPNHQNNWVQKYLPRPITNQANPRVIHCSTLT